MPQRYANTVDEERLARLEAKLDSLVEKVDHLLSIWSSFEPQVKALLAKANFLRLGRR
jgi:hypothetical protein